MKQRVSRFALEDFPPELRKAVEQALRDGEIVLTSAGKSVGRIVPQRQARGYRRPGSARGLIHMAEDFDATPDDLRNSA